jgi:pilus assembly protein CpaC
MSRSSGRAVARALLAVLSVAGLLAGTGAAPAQGPARESWTLTEPDHKSHIVVPPSTRFPIARKITIGLDKSMLIELPVDLQDVLVSNPEILDAVVKSSRQIYLLAKDVGDANAFLMGPDSQRLVLLEVTVARDLTALTDALNRLLPGARIKVEAVGDNVVLTGSVINPIDANRAAELASRYTKKKDAVVNMLAVAAKEQVLLKVQVAEMQRDAIRRIGVNIPHALVQSGNVTFTKVIQNAFPITASAVPQAFSGGPGAVPGVFAGEAGQATWAGKNYTVSAFIEALERAGLMRTLAEPNLTAISGETAKFLAGGEFPVPVSSEDRKISVAWKSFGVSVAFKPVVLTEGRISLNVSAEVSELSSDGAVTLVDISIPALKVRRAETTLELPSGGTLAMAGLLSDETRQSVEGVPWVKDMPVLGALFRSNDYKRRESELVILVTPYIATHAPKREFARPDGGYAALQHAARAPARSHQPHLRAAERGAARALRGRLRVHRRISGCGGEGMRTANHGAGDGRNAGDGWRLLVGLAALGAVLLTACEEHRRLENEMAVGLSNPQLRHPTAFSFRSESLDVEVPPRAEGLSPNQHVDVYRFLHRYKREATGRLIITAPEVARDHASLALSLQHIQRHAADAGIDYRLHRGARLRREAGVPVIRLAYERPVAVPPPCDNWEVNVGRNDARIPYPNWGCATERNTALMVDNARDLQEPQAEDPRSGERRSVTWSAYVGTPASGAPSSEGGDAAKKMAPTAKK